MANNEHDQYIHKIKANYDRLSKYYDLFSSSTESKLIRRTISRLNLSGIKDILDIGCGTGTGLVELARKFPHADRILGIDLSSGMCFKSLQKMGKFNLPNTPVISQADAIHLPFCTKSFDLIFISFSFEIFPPKLHKPLCRELHRVLKHNSTLSVVNIAKSGRRNPIFSLYKWGQKRFPSLIDCKPIDSHSILKANGFQITDSMTFNLWGIPVTSITAIN